MHLRSSQFSERETYSQLLVKPFSLIQMKIEIDSTEVLALKKLLDNNYISEAYIFSLKHFQT